MAVAVVAVLAGLLIAVYFLFLRKPYEVLFTDLRPLDASTIIADLEGKKIPYRLEDGGVIKVPAGLVERTRLSVMGEDLPLKGAVGFELFNKTDMGLTEFAQKINYQRALQGELARTIMTMETVEAARIHLSIPEPTLFQEDRRPPKASVTVIPRPGRQLPAGAVLGIQRLVAAAVPDLDASNVVVLDDQGQVVSGATFSDAPSSPVIQGRQAIERYYAARIRQVLQRVHPELDAEVIVWAEHGAASSDAEFDAALEGWTPEARRFPLRATIAVQAAPGPAGLAELRALAEQVLGLDPALGDTLTLTAVDRAWQGAPVAEPSPAVAPPIAAPAARRSAPLPGWPFLVMALAPLVVIALVVALFVKPGRPRRLSARQRARYSQRLKLLLDKEEADALQQT